MIAPGRSGNIAVDSLAAVAVRLAVDDGKNIVLVADVAGGYQLACRIPVLGHIADIDQRDRDTPVPVEIPAYRFGTIFGQSAVEGIRPVGRRVATHIKPFDMTGLVPVGDLASQTLQAVVNHQAALVDAEA